MRIKEEEQKDAKLVDLEEYCTRKKRETQSCQYEEEEDTKLVHYNGEKDDCIGEAKSGVWNLLGKGGLEGRQAGGAKGKKVSSNCKKRSSTPSMWRGEMRRK